MNWEWRWTQTKFGPLVDWLSERKGWPCDVVCQGRDGKRLVRFEDGRMVVAPRYAVRLRR